MKQKFKKWLYCCSIIVSSFAVNKSHAQCVELISNGSFESLSSQPFLVSQFNLINNWYGVAGTPDVFSASSYGTDGPKVSVPCNMTGYQYAHSGSVYAGIFTDGATDVLHPHGYNESIGSALTSTMQAGKIYDVTFWVSKADRGETYHKSLVVDFSNNTGTYTYTVPSSYLNNDSNWVKVNFPYCAVGVENDISIYANDFSAYIPSPTHTTSACTFTNNSGQYLFLDDFSIKELSYTIPTQTLCAKYTGTFTAVPSCTSINTAMYTYTWNYGDGSPAVTSNTLNVTTHSYAATPSGIYTASVTVGTGECSNTYTFNVVIPNVPITITSNINTICNGITNFTATPSPTGSYTYTWTVKDAATGTVVPTSNYTITAGTTNTPSINFGNITQNVNICVSITSTLGCQYSQCLYFPGCCPTPTNVLKYTNTTYNTTTALAALTGTNAILLSGTITVNSGATLIIGSKEVLMNPNTKIVLNGSGKISIASDYVHGCNYMWDGIYANGSTSGVTINNSRVEDAKCVVEDALGGASVTILNSYLNKNNMGVAFKAAKTSASVVSIKNTLFTCSSISTAGSVPKIPTAVNLTNAPTLGAYPTTFMLPPYDTQKSFCGINFGNASHTGKITNGINTNAITIGGATNEENVFDKMQVGVYAYDSKTHFQNNVFQNIKSTIAPTGLTNAGILVWGPIFGAGNGSYLSAGGLLTLKNTFRSNDNGLYNVGKSGILATHNTFSVQTTGVYVTSNNNGSAANINYNNFYQNGIAVNFYNNTYLTGNVKNNNMNNTAAAVGTNNDNFAIRCTEATIATNPSSYPAFDIDNNNISGFFNGIYAVNTLSLIATDNEVHMRQDNANDHWQSGIAVTGSNANKVINNIVDMPSLNQWAYWQSGIFMTSNQVPRVQCNSINKLSMSITFKQNNSTAATDGVKSNYMQNAKFGIWMHNNAVIGNQAGNTGTNSSDNVWNIPNLGTDTTYYTYMQGSSNPGNHIFFTRSLGSGFDIPSWKAKKDASINCFKMDGNNSSAAATGTACIANTATPSNLKVAGNALASLMQGADDILTDFDNEQNNGVSMASASASTNDNSADNTASLKAMNRRHLLYNLVLQNIDVQQDASLFSFMNSIKSNNTGLLLAVDSLIHQAEKKSSIIYNVKQANTAIVPSNLVEQSQQEFNNLYLEYLAQNKKLTPAQLSSMISIAQQCPSYYGVSVYQARTVLFDINKQTYRNACENVSPSRSSKRMAQTIDNAEQLTSVNVFPNPANNQLFVNANDYTQVSIKLYNIMGVLVADKIVVNNNSLDISNFASGLYTYKVYNNDTELKVGKLIITH